MINTKSIFIFLLVLPASLQAGDKPQLHFTPATIADDVRWWWALTVADVTGDGLSDLVHIDTNSTGGYLGYRVGSTKPGTWEQLIVADTAPDGRPFASGDLETGDFDGDGDIDLIGVSHPGEWADASATARIYWYENPSWTPRPIGESEGAVKDLSVADFNDDGRLDLAVLNFHSEQLRVYQQSSDGSFALAYETRQPGLHEGMDVGDLDGDGDADIAANGYAFLNPGSDDGSWAVETIDDRWHTQDGDWSRNATKNACADMDGDGIDEVFISHSERSGYPVMYYRRTAPGQWAPTTVADSLPAAHTLQVADMDQDGDLDVLTGVNKDRAWNLEIREFPVNIYLNKGDGLSFETLTIAEGGIYNGRVADFEGDGDYDLFRLDGHEAKTLELHLNTLAVDRWTYVEVDKQKPKWGDFDEPEWLRYFGLDMADVDGDDDIDILTGRNLYLNPSDGMQAEWARLDLGKNVDGVLFFDDGDGGPPKIIAQALPDVWLFEYDDGQFSSRVIAQVPPTGHHNGQGSRIADVIPGGKPEILLASQGGIYLLEIGSRRHGDNHPGRQGCQR